MALNTLLALITYVHGKLVDWKGGLAMAAAFIATPTGAYTAKFVLVKTLLILFALAVFAAAIRMTLFARQSEPEKMIRLKERSIIGGSVGAFAGFVGGMLGLGGGFIIALILIWMGYRTKQAAATTAFVVTFSSLSGYLGHVAEGHFNWTLTLIAVVTVIISS